jgi:hypothetical protein
MTPPDTYFYPIVKTEIGWEGIKMLFIDLIYILWWYCTLKTESLEIFPEVIPPKDILEKFNDPFFEIDVKKDFGTTHREFRDNSHENNI